MSGTASRGELWRALGAICDQAAPHPLLPAALGLPPADPAAHTELFVLQLVPYASAYLSADGMLGGEPADRVAGLWRVLGMVPPAEPDHLASLLGLYGGLVDAGADPALGEAAGAVLVRARASVLWEHLLPWAPAYLCRVAELGGAAHQRWAALLWRALQAEVTAVAAPPEPPPAVREAPPALGAEPDPRRVLAGVLAPGRSGVILTRADLARGAATLGLGLRLGERRYALQALLDQDPVATIGWLAAEAGRFAARLARSGRARPAPGRFWVARARATQARLLALAVAAGAGADAALPGPGRAG